MPLACLLVSHDALVPVVMMLERASASQISAFARLLQHVADDQSGETA